MIKRFRKPNPKYPEIILGRHAKAKHSIYNGQGAFAGYRIDSELSEDGKKETSPLAERIIKDGSCDLIIYSDMIRSKQTAEIISEVIREKTEKDIPIKEISDLHEIDVGDFTHHTQEWVMENCPESANVFYNGDIKNWNFPGGESYKEIIARVKLVFEKVIKLTKPGEKVLLIGHGMFNRVMLSVVFPEKPELWQETGHPHDRLVSIRLPDDINSIV